MRKSGAQPKLANLSHMLDWLFCTALPASTYATMDLAGNTDNRCHDYQPQQSKLDGPFEKLIGSLKENEATPMGWFFFSQNHLIATDRRSSGQPGLSFRLYSPPSPPGGWGEAPVSGQFLRFCPGPLGNTSTSPARSFTSI